MGFGKVQPARGAPDGIVRERDVADFARPDQVIGVNMCAQARTYIFPTIFTVWDQAGFVKVNLKDDDWATGRAGARRFLADWAKRMQAHYCMVSFPPNFEFPGKSLPSQVVEKIIMIFSTTWVNPMIGQEVLGGCKESRAKRCYASKML